MLYEPVPKEFVSQTAIFDYRTPLTQALNTINKCGAVIVTKNNEYYGIADTRAVFRKGSSQSLKFSKALPVGRFARKLPVLDSDASIGKAIGYFHEFSAKALPYEEDNRIKGIVKRELVLSSIVSLHLLSKMRVSDAMSTPVLAIDADANVSQAINSMSQNRVTRLVVLDKGKVLGLITLKDIHSGFARLSERIPEKKSAPQSLSNVQVRSVATTTLHAIDYSRPIEEAIKKMLENKISSLVVTRGWRPVGILSMRDVFEVAASAIEKVRSRVIITGMDDYTKEYQQDIEREMNRLIDKIDRFGRMEVNYASLNIKRVKSKGYELKARLALQRKGVVFSCVSGYGLESTLTKLLENLFNLVKEKKEVIVSGRKEEKRHYVE